MSNQSNVFGRAYEYICIETLNTEINKHRKSIIEDSSTYEIAKECWNIIDKETKETFEQSALTAVYSIFDLEPMITEKDDDCLVLKMQKDQEGKIGDVRDIIIIRNEEKGEIGLSIKHNHEAIKHSRLSHRLDFGKEWFEIPCSDSYWKSVRPIFDKLKEEKGKNAKWTDIKDKEQSVYIPLLQAFMDEIKRSYKSDQNMPRKMVEYLIGIKDYYKIVSYDNKRLTLIHTFNMHDTLNKPAKNKKSEISVPVIELPTRLIALEFKPNSTNTVEMYLDNGWQLSFRIHNASSKVEPSLKFDVQFIGMPVSILNFECKWHK